MSRRERRKQEIRDRMIEAAVDLFEAQGVGATRVAEIAERADVANKTFFNHFPSKQHLLDEISRRGLDQLLVDLEDARKHACTTRERVHYFFEHLAANAAEVGPMHRDLLTTMIQVSASDDAGEGEQTRKLHDAFGAIVRDGLASGDLSQRHSPETFTEMLMGAFYVLMFNWANLDHYPLRERALESARFLGDAMTISEEERP